MIGARISRFRQPPKPALMPITGRDRAFSGLRESCEPSELAVSWLASSVFAAVTPPAVLATVGLDLSANPQGTECEKNQPDDETVGRTAILLAGAQPIQFQRKPR